MQWAEFEHWGVEGEGKRIMREKMLWEKDGTKKTRCGNISVGSSPGVRVHEL